MKHHYLRKVNFGKITIIIEEKTIYEINILAKNSVRKKNVKDYMLELTKELLGTVPKSSK